LHACTGAADRFVAVGFEIGSQVIVQALKLGLLALAASLQIGFAGLAQFALAGVELGLDIGEFLLPLLKGVLPGLELGLNILERLLHFAGAQHSILKIDHGDFGLRSAAGRRGLRFRRRQRE